MNAAHQYRNEVYHIGLTHDDIVRPIAFQYFKLCCELFIRLEPGLRSYSSTDRFTEVAQRYLPMRGDDIDFLAVDNAQLAHKLRSNLSDSGEVLQLSLSASAHSKIEAIRNSYEFVVRENPARHNKRIILRSIQWHHDLMRVLEREGIEESWMDSSYLDEVHRVRTELEPTWRQRHKSVPLAGWRRRAETIMNEQDPLKAMELYQALRNDMAYLEDAISDAARELDAWIQSEVERACGK